MKPLDQIRTQVHSERGAFGSVLLGLLLIAACGIAALGADVAHLVSVKAQLQNAVDAGALGGAQDLLKIAVTPQDQTTASTDARTITAVNVADSTPVSNNTPGTNVTVAVAGVTAPYTVTVQATRQAGSLFASIFGIPSEAITSKAVAQASWGLKTLAPDQAIDIGVSLDWIPPNGLQQGRALDSYAGLPIGQSFTVILNPQSQTNAAWIKDWGSFYNPQIDFGSTVVNLDNGTVGSSEAPYGVGDIIVMPIFLGAPPFNYSATVYGVVALKITNIDWPHKITGILSTPILRGEPGTPFGLPGQEGQYLTQYAPQVLQLIQ
ncbi:MAG: hypothetical protein C5B53_05350 [Candidatus Melainabacteria bacterium]|nr:MAG: hypothetical protein C5B53_05350 [Candidatus Melainabacteria bacterium]